jgi:hypothetical protein
MIEKIVGANFPISSSHFQQANKACNSKLCFEKINQLTKRKTNTDDFVRSRRLVASDARRDWEVQQMYGAGEKFQAEVDRMQEKVLMCGDLLG